MDRPESRLSSLQQDRSRETRRRLLEAAQVLWVEKGFDDTTVSDVCEVAGVAKGTFYFYFPHKEDLLVEVARATAGNVYDEIGPLFDADAPTEALIDAVIVSIARRVERTPKDLLARALLELYKRAGDWQELRGDNPDFGVVFGELFERAQRRGDVSSDFHPLELANMLSTACINGMLAWASGMVGPMDVTTVLRRRATLILNGARVGL